LDYFIGKSKQLISDFQIILGSKSIYNNKKFIEILKMSEHLNRLKKIDVFLRDSGWEADTVNLNFEKGTRPKKNRNIAIAEWPCGDYFADYALFIGNKLYGFVEAKKKSTDVVSKIPQAKRYSRNVIEENGAKFLNGTPWDKNLNVPFLYSANGREFNKSIPEKSGIWFFDSRNPYEFSRPLVKFHSPNDLINLFNINKNEFKNNINLEEFNYDFNLRYYQIEAIKAVERSIISNSRNCLLSMATGTGKTKTALILLYRMLKLKRFSKILFVVDRSYLGKQAYTDFRVVKVEGNKSLTDIFPTKGLYNKDVHEDDAIIQIETVQTLIKKISSKKEKRPSILNYDCIIVDECHRGYLLDKEMSKEEINTKDQSDYLSAYRMAIEYFDALKIGLTATPAVHTVDVFGKPIYSYSYRDAVVDGYLCDYEPPIEIKTKLANKGIKIKRNEEIEFLNQEGKVTKKIFNDEIQYDLKSFNKAIIADDFNNTVCKVIAQKIDPESSKKTLIFATNDFHADLIVSKLKTSLKEEYGIIHDDCVMKITGQADRPGELTDRFRNENYPNIAVTVDLLTTGVDIPAICNIVFLRRVKSRILFDQMIGRATRACPELNKEYFNIYDAVGQFKLLSKLTSMEPVVATKHYTFKELIDDLNSKSFSSSFKEVLKDHFISKINLKIKNMEKSNLQEINNKFSISVEKFVEEIKEAKLKNFINLVNKKENFFEYIDKYKNSNEILTPISRHKDELISAEQNFKIARTADDYIEKFNLFIKNNINYEFLKMAVNKPKDLSIKELKLILRLLEKNNFSKTFLDVAWKKKSGKDTLVSIVCYIRKAAIGDPLIPFNIRVDKALELIIDKNNSLSRAQINWLKKITNQIKKETIIDKKSFDVGRFKDIGGYNRINKIFNGNLMSIVKDLQNKIWEEAS
tara:strand:- start:2438 stop:5191 length:2754 start_codon:yes stop_codon:yes gene_type:complete